VNAGEGRGFGLQKGDKFGYLFRFGIYFNFHPCGGIFNPTLQLKALRQVIHKRAKANALNNAGDVKVCALHEQFFRFCTGKKG